MLERFRHSYFGRLFLHYIILSVLLVALTGLLILASSSASVQSGMLEQTRSGVRAVAESLDALLGRSAEVIRELAADATVRAYLESPDAATRYEVARILYLSNVNFRGGVTTHVVRISDGGIVSTGEVSPVFAPENYNETFTLFKRILSSDDVAVYTTVKGIRMLRDTRVILAKAVRDDRGEPLGYVAVEVSRDALASIVSSYSFVSSRPIMVVDPYDVVLYNSAGDEGEGLSKLAFRSDFGEIWATDASSGAFDADNLCWTKTGFARYAAVSEVSPALLNSVLSSTSRTVLPVLLVTCFLGILFAYFFARTVSAPIRKLTLAMGEAEKGNFRALVPVTSRDEIGRLSEAFNHMQLEIEELIARIGEKQRSLRVAEVNALALQVNPHFLYNTLDLIKWCVKLDRRDDALMIVVRLGKLLRRLMNNRADVIPVAEEMEVVRAYLEIQKCRHRESIDMRFDIDPALLKKLITKSGGEVVAR